LALKVKYSNQSDVYYAKHNTLFSFIVIRKKCIKEMPSHLELAGILEYLII